MTIESVGGANTCLSMILVGTILASIPFHALIDKEAAYYAAIRLVVLPAAALALCTALHFDTVLTKHSLLFLCAAEV